jgi:hypothetical protein
MLSSLVCQELSTRGKNKLRKKKEANVSPSCQARKQRTEPREYSQTQTQKKITKTLGVRHLLLRKLGPRSVTDREEKKTMLELLSPPLSLSRPNRRRRGPIFFSKPERGQGEKRSH